MTSTKLHPVDMSLARPGDICHTRRGEQQIYKGPSRPGDLYSDTHPFCAGNSREFKWRRDGSFSTGEYINHQEDCIRIERNGVLISPVPAKFDPTTAPPLSVWPTREGETFIFGAYNPTASEGYRVVGWDHHGEVIGLFANGKYTKSTDSDEDIVDAAPPLPFVELTELSRNAGWVHAHTKVNKDNPLGRGVQILSPSTNFPGYVTGAVYIHWDGAFSCKVEDWPAVVSAIKEYNERGTN